MKTGRIDEEILRRNISKRITEDIQCNRVGAAAVAVLQRGSVNYCDTFGTQIPNGDEPLRKDAIFRIASMTKPITVIAVLMLVQSGKLRLEDQVAEYLPQYAQLKLAEGDGYCATPLRIWHLLTHTSGMETNQSYRDLSRHLPAEIGCSLSKSVDYYATLPLAYEPGTQRRYSGRVTFDILGRIVELASGQGFAEFVHNRIFVPCGMADTTFSPTSEQWNRIVGMHDLRDGLSVTVETVPGCVVDDIPPTHPMGGSGLISTLSDYVRFAQMLLNKGMTPGGRILDADLVTLMATPQLPSKLMSVDVNQGLGVRVITGEGYPWLHTGTFGWSGAYGTHFWVDPFNDIIAVYMKNSRYDGGSGAHTAKNFEEDVYRSIC